MPSIVEVAERAGVSQATVSRVLGGKVYVAPETKERVEHAIEALGYKPNSLGKALRSGHTQAVALIVSDIEQGWYASLSKQLQSALSRSKLDMLLFDLSHDEARLKHLLSRAVELRLKGVVLAASDKFAFPDLEPELDLLRRHASAIISVGQSLDRFGICSVVHEDKAAGATGVRHLVGIGCRRIAYINRLRTSATGQSRLDGYLEGLREAGIEADPALVRESRHFRYEAGYAAVKELAEAGVAFDAILAGTDEIAIGAMACCSDLGLRIPADVAVVGFGGLDIGQYSRPSLTTLEGDPESIALRVIEELDAPTNRSFAVPRRLRERQSTERR